MRHLLGLEYLTREEILSLLENAEGMVEVSSRELKKVPALRGKTIINLFFEASTRTRTSFEIAGKRLSADVINLSVASSSVSKGESLLDTVKTLEAMSPDILVIRHASSGVPDFLAKVLRGVAVANAGDGTREHPTQGLLDCLTLKQYFSERGKALDQLKVAIVGDVFHSRVARSNIWAHLKIGNEVRLVGPPTMVPKLFEDPRMFAVGQTDGAVSNTSRGIRVFHRLSEGLEGADVVMCLRVQTERLQQFFIPTLEEYSREYCISERVLAACAPHAVVLHPGPANRGVEVSSEVLDGPRSLVATQVANGIAVRMAVLFALATAQVYPSQESQGVKGVAA